LPTTNPFVALSSSRPCSSRMSCGVMAAPFRLLGVAPPSLASSPRSSSDRKACAAILASSSGVRCRDRACTAGRAVRRIQAMQAGLVAVARSPSAAPEVRLTALSTYSCGDGRRFGRGVGLLLRKYRRAHRGDSHVRRHSPARCSLHSMRHVDTPATVAISSTVSPCRTCKRNASRCPSSRIACSMVPSSAHCSGFSP